MPCIEKRKSQQGHEASARLKKEKMFLFSFESALCKKTDAQPILAKKRILAPIIPSLLFEVGFV